MCLKQKNIQKEKKKVQQNGKILSYSKQWKFVYDTIPFFRRFKKIMQHDLKRFLIKDEKIFNTNINILYIYHSLFCRNWFIKIKLKKK